jgi:SAM-dependent methyltransferase
VSPPGWAAAYSATGAAWDDGPGRVYGRLADHLVAASPVDLRGRTLLDVGAGTGAASRAIARAGGIPLAVDRAIGMLAATPAPAAARAVGDLAALPLGPATVDGVVAAFSFNHVADPHRALAEAARVTRPGGPVLVSAYAEDDHHVVKEVVDAVAGSYGWVPPEWVDELRTACLPQLATVPGARRAASRAGLPQAEVDLLEVPFPELGPHDLVAWRLGMAQLAPFVAGLPPDQRAALEAEATGRLAGTPPLVRRVIVVVATR